MRVSGSTSSSPVACFAQAGHFHKDQHNMRYAELALVVHFVAWANFFPSFCTVFRPERASPTLSFPPSATVFVSIPRASDGSLRPCFFLWPRPPAPFPQGGFFSCSLRMIYFRAELFGKPSALRASAAFCGKCPQFMQQGKEFTTCIPTALATMPTSSTSETELRHFSNLLCLLREQGAYVCPQGFSIIVSSLSESVSSEGQGSRVPKAGGHSRALLTHSLDETFPQASLAARSADASLPSCLEAGASAAHVRGLRADRSYSAGDILAWIPDHLHFSEERLLALWGSSLASDLRAGISFEAIRSFLHSDFLRAADWQLRLAILVAFLSDKGWLRTKRTDRKTPGFPCRELWCEYEALFPRDLSHLLLFWKAKELRMLEHPMVNAVFSRLFAVHSAVDNLKKHCQGRPISRGTPQSDLLGDFPQKLKWSLSVVCSRNIKVHGNAKPGMLIPFLDLLNCGGESANAKLRRSFEPPDRSNRPTWDAPRPMEGPGERVGGTGLVAASSIKAGDEITIRYCDDADMQLLNYGFFRRTPREYVRTERRGNIESNTSGLAIAILNLG